MQLLKMIECDRERNRKKDLDNLVSHVGLQCGNDTSIQGNMQ